MSDILNKQISSLVKKFDIKANDEAFGSFLKEVGEGKAFNKQELDSLEKVLTEADKLDKKATHKTNKISILTKSAIDQVVDFEKRNNLISKYGVDVNGVEDVIDDIKSTLEVSETPITEAYGAEQAGGEGSNDKKPKAKTSNPIKKLLNASAASKMLADDSFASKSGLSGDTLEKYKSSIATAYEAAEQELKNVSSGDLEAMKAPDADEIKNFFEEVSGELGEDAHTFTDGTDFKPSDAISERIENKIKSIKDGFEHTPPPSNQHTNLFNPEKLEKIKLSENETKLFKDVTDHKGKAALEEIFSKTQLEKIQEKVGGIAAARNVEDVTKAKEGLQKHVEALVSDSGALKDLKPEARAGVVQRVVGQAADALKEVGEGEGKISMFDDAKKALEKETLAKTIAEKSGSKNNWFSKVGERASSMMEGVNATSGEALKTSTGKFLVGGGATVALGGIYLGAKNVVRGVAGYENPETGEHEDASFGKVAFGAAEIAGGAVAGLKLATGRVR